MVYYTESELRTRGGLTASRAATIIKEAARTATGSFDIFLSHSIIDAAVVLGLKNLLEEHGQTVYVDWIEDAELDRTRVSPQTAERLRQRMRSSRSLVYATSRAASRSRWMPWELGYFDGTKGGDRISICPIESGSSLGFVGEEYLGLYKRIERISWYGEDRASVVRPSGDSAQRLRSFVEGSGGYVPVA